MANWQPAKPGDVCTKASLGWYTTQEDRSDRCGKPAIAKREQTCGCGACDMSFWACADHKREYDKKAPS